MLNIDRLPSILSSLQKLMNVRWAYMCAHRNINVRTRLEPMTVTATREDGTLTSHLQVVKVTQ